MGKKEMTQFQVVDGNNTIDGGAGIDTVSYFDASNVTLSLRGFLMVQQPQYIYGEQLTMIDFIV